MTNLAEFLLNVTYAQIAIFDRSYQHPFNQWTDRHVRQGFSWRPGSVAFRTIEESGQHKIVITIGTHDAEPTPGAARVIDVPFETPPNGEIEVGSISESINVDIQPGTYQLRFECRKRSDSEIPIVLFHFVKMEQPQFRLVRADADLDPDVELLRTAIPA